MLKTIRILTVSGSLRAASINTALLAAATALAPVGVTLVPFARLGEFPLFNPDTEYPLPAPVRAFREQLNAADGVLIASPEYAHGVTGVMKNALDWVVGCEAFVHKPTAVLNASARAVHADAALKETPLGHVSRSRTGGVRHAADAWRKARRGSIAAHPEIAFALREALAALHDTS